MRTSRGAVCGLAAGGVAVGIAQFAAAFGRPPSGPLVAVGSVMIDRTPEWLKEYAIRTFGTHDKLVLLTGLGAGVTLCAVLLGVLATWRLAVGTAGFAAFGLVAAAAALTRPYAGPVDAVPGLVGGAAGAIAIVLLLRPAPMATGRRGFLLTLGGTAGVALAAGAGGRLLAGRSDVAGARSRLRLPRPASPAPPEPARADLRLAGLTPFVTRNADFYRVDTALVLPQVDPAAWTLRVHGLVDRPLELTFDDLLRLPLLERDITLTCVSNEVGGPYAGNARWLGASLGALLRRAGVQAGADQLLGRSADGMTIGTPLAAVLDGRDALLAVGMNGEPLPVAHGFPARTVVPGLYGYVSATKWVVDLEVTRFTDAHAYWTRRGWATDAPIKTMARIDLPRPLATLPPGKALAAGVAWAQHRGIAAVELRVDGGPWRRAELAPVPNTDTWRQWVCEWTATPGSHTLEARATDATGRVQSEQRASPFPDGAAGWQSIVVNVG